MIENSNQSKIDIKIDFSEGYLWLFDHCVAGFFLQIVA